jgi:hypothetical protein
MSKYQACLWLTQAVPMVTYLDRDLHNMTLHGGDVLPCSLLGMRIRRTLNVLT